VHAHEPVRSVVLGYAAEHGIPVRRAEYPGGIRDDVEMAACLFMVDRLISSFRRQETKLDHLREIIAGLTPGWAELPCHLRFERFPKSGYARQRIQELETLRAASVKPLLEKHGVSLVSQAELLTRDPTEKES